MIVVEHIGKTIADQGVHDLPVAHAGTPTGICQHIGCGGHALGAAGYNDIRISHQDGTGAGNHRFHARAAQHVDTIGGDRVGQAGLDTYLPGHILSLGSGKDTAKHQLIHLFRMNSGPPEGFLHHNGAQIRGGNVLQGTAEGTHGGAAAIDDVDFFHS